MENAPDNKKEVTISRVFNAPRRLVFTAWTDEKHLAQWWGPHGFTNPVCELDLRPGGNIRIDMMSPNGIAYPMKGVFHEVVAPERLLFTSRAFEDAAGHAQLEVYNRVTFTERNGQTELALNAVVVKRAPSVEAAIAGMEEGWKQTMDRLRDYLAKANAIPD